MIPWALRRSDSRLMQDPLIVSKKVKNIRLKQQFRWAHSVIISASEECVRAQIKIMWDQVKMTTTECFKELCTGEVWGPHSGVAEDSGLSWHVTLCRWVSDCQRCECSGAFAFKCSAAQQDLYCLSLEDEGSTTPWNGGNQSRNNAATLQKTWFLIMYLLEWKLIDFKVLRIL